MFRSPLWLHYLANRVLNSNLFWSALLYSGFVTVYDWLRFKYFGGTLVTSWVDSWNTANGSFQAMFEPLLKYHGSMALLYTVAIAAFILGIKVKNRLIQALGLTVVAFTAAGSLGLALAQFLVYWGVLDFLINMVPALVGLVLLYPTTFTKEVIKEYREEVSPA